MPDQEPRHGVEALWDKYTVPSKLGRVLRAQDHKREAEKQKRETYAAVDQRDERQCCICGRRGNPYATTVLGRLHHVHLLDASKGGEMVPSNIYLGCWICHAVIHAKQLKPIGENANERLEFEIDEAAVVHVFGSDELPKHCHIVLPNGRTDGVMSEKPKEPALCTTNGKPVDDVRASQTNETGQHEGYIVLCPDERAKGLVRPYRDRYTHLKCGSVTKMGHALSETYARDPTFYGATFCVNCNRHLPVSEFVWTVDGQVVGS